MSQGRSDPDDFFSETRMSFGDHLEELRWHLWRAVIGFVLILILVFVFDFVGYLTDTHFGIGRPMMDLITKPVEDALVQYYDERAKNVKKAAEENPETLPENVTKPQRVRIAVNAQELADEMARRLKLPPPEKPEKAVDGGTDDADYVTMNVTIKPYEIGGAVLPALQKMGPRPSVMTLTLMEAMMVYFKVAIVCGVVLGSPWIFWQLWAFVASGLYPHEKKYVHIYLPFSLGLFLAGVLLCEFMVIPKAIEALLWFNEWLNIEPNFRLEDWLSFAITMPLVFGISFQVPLVMLFLERLGITRIETYRSYRKVSIFLMAIFAAVITPTPDVVNFSLLWVPMCLLYELGIWLCKFAHKPSEFDIEQPDTQEMVEV